MGSIFEYNLTTRKIMAFIDKLKKTQSTLSNKKLYIPILAAVLIIIIATGAYSKYAPKHDPETLTQALHEGNYEDVIRISEALLKKNPQNLAIIHILAAAYVGQAVITGEKEFWFKKEFNLLTASIKISDNAESERLLGLGYFVMGNYPLANTYYQKALALSLKNSITLSNLGQLYETIRAFPKAKTYYAEALAYDASNELAQLGEIRALYREGKTGDAYGESYKMVRETDNIMTKATLEEIMGLYQLSEKETAKAESHFKKALAYNPMLPVSLTSYAQILLDAIHSKPFNNIMKATELPEALALRAVAVQKDYSYGYAVLSRIEMLRGNTAKAAEYGAKVLASLPNDTSLSVETKKALAKSFSTSTPAISNFKVISIKQVTATSSAAVTTQQQ